MARSGDYVMPFGKHKGKTLAEIADDDEGVRYLDWMRGVRGVRDEGDGVRAAIDAFLDDPIRSVRIKSVLDS